MAQAVNVAELQRIGGELKPALKQQLVAKDLNRVRNVYAEHLAQLRPAREEQLAQSEPAASDPARNGS
jgi:hypothetical protein